MNHRRSTTALVSCLAALAILNGCASHPPAVLEAKIPVEIPCEPPLIPRPAFAVDGLPLGAGIPAQMKALRAERKQRQAYELELEAAVEACR